MSVPSFRGLIFDVDGTLYRAAPVRRGVVARLLWKHGLRPFEGRRVVSGLSAFRRAQETLRGRAPAADLHAEQLAEAERTSRQPAASIAAWVARWMETEPLPLVARAARPGLRGLLETAGARGVALGVLSDYPPRPKLAALGIESLFGAVRWAQEADVGTFKPDPRGLLAVVEALELDPRQVLYVGDRADVDAAVARAAGVDAALVGVTGDPTSETTRCFAGFEELGAWLFDGRAPASPPARR